MKIGNYAVQMDAQYYNLQAQSTRANITTNSQSFHNQDSLEVKELHKSQDLLKDEENRLSAQLSKALLHNIASQTARTTDRIELSQTTIEAQALNLSIEALIEADDKEISLSLDLELSRSFIQHTRLSIEELKRSLVDPLVISLGGSMPTLSSKTFSFDIDSDGKSDQISQLSSGNGFLALDKNSNGKIDNGSELFGTKSGDGFKDLGRYDDDKNGWIDENDKIFDKLRIWQKDGDKESLVALGEVGIGAIFLGSTTTPFSLKDNANNLLGEMRKSGFVLFESGRAGVMSHIDLAMQTKDELNKLDLLQTNLSLNQLHKKYINSQESGFETDSNDTKIEKLQKKINELEKKLLRASEDEKATIQVQIGALFSQIVSLMEKV